MSATAALRAGIAALLEARGAKTLAEVVARAEIDLVGPGEAWTLGGRAVRADRVALVVDAPDLVFLGADPARIEAIRDAATAAMRSPTTELAELSAVLRLPSVGRAWRDVYRGDARLPSAEPPTDEAVLAGAAALAEASGDDRAAAMMRRGRLEHAAVPSSGSIGLTRWVLRLAADDLARAERDVALAHRLARSVEAAATRAADRCASVDLALALPG